MAAQSYEVKVVINKDAMAKIVYSNDVQNGMDKLANAGLEMQKRLVPVLTGRLRNGLTIKRTPDGGRQIGVFDVGYARYVEEGHKTRGGTFVPAQPYIRPSLDAIRKVLSNG